MEGFSIVGNAPGVLGHQVVDQSGEGNPRVPLWFLGDAYLDGARPAAIRCSNLLDLAHLPLTAWSGEMGEDFTTRTRTHTREEVLGFLDPLEKVSSR